MYSGSSLEVRNVIISIGIKKPESLKVSQNQSQTSEMNSGGSLEVKKNVTISIGTTDSRKSASVHEKVAGQWNSLFKVLVEVNNIIISIGTKKSLKSVSSSGMPKSRKIDVDLSQ
jgi:hypothetical protein